MSLLVTGTIGIDTVETPHGKAVDVLGGSAAYFSFAASLLSPVRLVGAVGDDFPPSFRELFAGRPIDTAGLETRSGSRTFRWAGRYAGDMSSAQTLRTDLNVVAEAPPDIPEPFRDSRFVFLANTHPALQRQFAAQLKSPALVVCDTMNLWIETARDELLKTFRAVDGVIFNDGEARLLTGQTGLLDAGRAVLDLGPKLVVIKKGEHGAVALTRDDMIVMPAYPTDRVKDPTGAGDSFAGGMMGYLASVGRSDAAALKAAMARGACAASITIEAFSLEAIRAATPADLHQRLNRFRQMLTFE
jgi:sugar/nucleoside kinase (ribokinase family)